MPHPAGSDEPEEGPPCGTPRALADVDQWIRHRVIGVRALQLKHWKRGRTPIASFALRGCAAAQVAANSRRRCGNSAMATQIALPTRAF